MHDKISWIVMDDEEITAVKLETAVEQNLSKRRMAIGTPPPIDFPSFGYRSPMPRQPASGAVSKTLYHHLRHLNEMDAPETAPILQSSPATKIPLLGRFWGMIRKQAHGLVLFYVNRTVAYETAVNTHTLNTLNELTRLTQSQQEEIRRLQTVVAQLQGGKTDG